MITRSEWRRGMRAWWVFVGVMSSVGCYRHRRIEPTTLTRSSNAAKVIGPSFVANAVWPPKYRAACWSVWLKSIPHV